MAKLPAPSKAFFTMTYEDIYAVAKDRGMKELTEDELHQVVKMYENGNNWHEIISIALQDIESDRQN